MCILYSRVRCIQERYMFLTVKELFNYCEDIQSVEYMEKVGEEFDAEDRDKFCHLCDVLSEVCSKYDIKTQSKQNISEEDLSQFLKTQKWLQCIDEVLIESYVCKMCYNGIKVEY